MVEIETRPLTKEAFAPFGQVVEMAGAEPFAMNAGRAQRFYDLAKVELAGPDPRPIVSLARSQPATLPYALTMMERHPLGSQMFFPLGATRFLVTVAPDDNGRPGTPLAFVAGPGQGVNYARNAWHGVLTPLDAAADFIIVDRGGAGDNLVEYPLPAPFLVVEAAAR